jgi:cobalt-zinc-cadmium efflux system outer membrane protein
MPTTITDRRRASMRLLVLCAVSVMSAVAAGETTVLTLEQALARASSEGSATLIAASERERAAARARQARAWENPTLSVEVENVLGRGPYRDFDAAESTVSLSQPLPLGGGRGARVRAARSDEQAATVALALAALELRRDVALAYAEAIAADRLAGIARERAALGAQTRAAVERRHAAGLESDLQRARVEVETAGMQADARRRAAAALAHRRALASHWREATVTAALDEAWFDAAPDGAFDGVPDAAPDAASTHPRLVVARARVEQARAELEGARRAPFSGLEATVGTRRFEDAPGADHAWVLGLSMPLPVWDRNEGGIAEARAALQGAEFDLERAARDLLAEREAALAERDAATLEVDALTMSGLPSSKSLAHLSVQGYEAGRLSLIERLDAERALVQTQEDLVAARLRLRQSEARVAAVIADVAVADAAGRIEAAQASSTER